MLRFLLCATISLTCSLSFGQAEKTPVIATSGNVEIDSIKIVREVASDAAVNADLTNMQISLWFAGNPAAMNSRYLVRFVELESIQDDAGSELLPDRRRELMKFLKEPARIGESKQARGKAGPVVHINLDAPVRNALHLKSIKGTAIVSQPSFDRLQFEDLASMNDKALEHESLAEFPVRATVRLEDGDTVVVLKVPEQHEMLITWGLVKNGRMLEPNSEGVGTEDGTSTLECTYGGDVIKDCTLGLMIAKPDQSISYRFEFKDVPLP